jgi:hypothetical protein
VDQHGKKWKKEEAFDLIKAVKTIKESKHLLETNKRKVKQTLKREINEIGFGGVERQSETFVNTMAVMAPSKTEVKPQ